MKNKSTLTLGDSEMEVLVNVWELKEATVAQVHERILAKRKVAYTTIMTMMQKLAKKGYLRYRKDGVTYVYSAAIDPSQVKQDMLGHIINKVFKGSPTALMQTLVDHEEITDAERDTIKAIINKLN
jgi:BlaI family transcriptional regulator, penicillinase repressor